MQERSAPGGPNTSRHRVSLRGERTSGAADASPVGRAGSRPNARRSVVSLRTLSGSEDGFTLVELLVVVLMLVTLIGIAVPTFINQRDNAFDAAVRSDLRSAAIALESYRAQNAVYAAAAVTGESWGYVRSPDVMSVVNVPETGDDYCVIGWYEPEQFDDQGDPILRGDTPTDIAAKAEWAITPDGMVSLTEVAAPEVCP